MKNLIPKAIEGRPWTAFAIMVVFSFGPAFNLTVEEWKDVVDTNTSTVWNAELVIDAWADGLKTVFICIYAYLTRSGTKEKETP